MDNDGALTGMMVRSRASIDAGHHQFDEPAPLAGWRRRSVSLVGLFLLLTMLPLCAEEDRPAAVEAEDALRLEGAGRVVLDGRAGGGLAVASPAKGVSGVLHLEVESDEAGPRTVWVRSRGHGRLRATVAGGQGPVWEAGPSGGWAWSTPARTAWRVRAGAVVLKLEFGNEVAIDRVVLLPVGEEPPQGIGPAPVRKADPPDLSDRFQEEELGPAWTVVCGSWTTKKPVERTSPNKASNAFMLQGAGVTENEAAGVVVAGDPMWRNYAFGVSARTVEQSGRFGLVFGWRDPKNHYLVRFDAGRDAGEVALVRVVDGERTVLARRDGRLRVRQFYRIDVEMALGRIAVEVDGHELLRVRDATFLTGQVGLWTGAEGGILFDDVFVREWREVRETFDRGVDPTRWQGEESFLALRGGGVVHRAGALSMLTTGRPGWTDYSVAAKLEIPEGTTGGVVIGRSEQGRAWAFVLDRAGGNRARLIRIDDGTERTLRKVPLPAVETLEEPVHLEAEMYHGLLVGLMDGKKVLEHYLGNSPGAAGVAACGSGVRIHGVEVRFGEKDPPEPAANTVFRRDKYMEDWASTSGEWSMEEETGTAWHRRDFYGNAGAGYDLPRLLAQEETVVLHLCAEDTEPESGYALTVSPLPGEGIDPPEAEREGEGQEGGAGGSPQTGEDQKGDGAAAGRQRVRMKLTRRGEAVVETTGWLCERSQQEERHSGSERREMAVAARVQLERRGRHLVYGQEGGEEHVWVDEAPLEGLRQGVTAPEAGMALERIRVASDQLFNDIFASAAVDWRRDRGDWRMKNRFWCAPQWAWYGGRSKSSAILWHKDSFPNDFTFDLYTSMQMDRNGRPNYFRPGFMNITACADGRDLDSGYSLVYGAEGGTVTRLYRGDKIVAETRDRDALPPPIRDQYPGYWDLHRRWWHWRCQRRGGRLRFYLDGELLFDYEDADPLPGDRLAVWTEHRGIMVSRARVSYRRRGEREFPLLANPSAAPGTTTGPEDASVDEETAYHAGFEAGLDGWQALPQIDAAHVRRVDREGGGAALEVRNPAPGGRFGALLRLQDPIDLLHSPWIGFDMRLDADARVNLYCRFRDEWFAIPLTAHRRDIDSDIYPGAPIAPGKGTRILRVLGSAAEVRREEGWQRVAFNLGDALLQRAGEISGDVPEELLVDALFFGSLELDDLVQSGFGCNGAGCSYAFDDLRIYGTDATAGLVSVSTTAAEVDGAGVCWIPVDTPEGMPWLDMQTVSARTGTGPALPRRAFKFDPIGGRLGVDLMALEAGDEPPSKLKLAGLRLRDSEEDGQSVEVAIKPRTEEEGLLLAPVDLLGQKPVVRETFGGPFAQDMAEWIRAWSPDDGGVLRLVCRTVAHRMLTGRLVAERDLAQYPVYSFRYRADPGVRCDLLVRAGEAEAWLSFLNRGQALAGRPGRLAGADDGRWHWVAAPVGPAWCRTAKNAAGTVLESLQFVDRGYCAQADGLTMLLDDLTAYPLLKPDADGAVRVRFARRDPGRLDEIRYVVTAPGEAGPDLAGRERPDGVASLQTDRRFVEERIALPRAGVRVLRWAARADSFWQEGPPCLLAVDQVPPEISALHPRPRVSSTDSHGAAARTEELVEGCLAVLRRGGGDVVDEAFGRLHAHLEAMPPGDREAAAEPLRRLHHERGKEIGEAVRRQVAESLLIPLQHWFGRDAAAFERWLGRNARETRERLKRTVARALDSDDEAARAFAAEYLAAVGLATGGWRAGERTKGLLLLARADRSAADASGSGLEGTLSEGVSFAEGGVFGSAFRFAGSGGEEANAVSFGDLDALDSAGAFSVALWFRRDRDRAGNSNHGTSNILVSQGSDEGNDNLEIGTDGSHVELYLDTVGGDKPRVYDAGIRDGVWYHLALTYDATRPCETALYLDGREVHRWTAWDGPLDGSGQSPFTLGNTYHEEAPFEGLIDEVAVFTRALCPDEIAEYCERSGLTARSSGERITCRLDDEGLGIRPGSISVRINGSGPPEAANPIRYHPLDGHLVVRTADWPRRTAGAFAEDGERIEVQVEARDLAGSRVERTWSWTMDYGRDRTAPPLPRLVWQPVEGRLLQPADLTDAKSILSWDEEETQVRVREGGPLEGKVLEVRGGRKSVGAVTLNTSPIDLRQGLIIGGWVRRHPRFRANFRFFVGGQVYGLRFLDRHQRGVVPAGRIPLEKPDDGWQFFFVDAAELIRAELPKGTTRIVRRIDLGHPGRRRNRPHVWLRLAHLFVSSDEDLRNGIAVDWSVVRDPTGVEYALLRDANAATVPESGYREECHAVVESVAPGDYLHLGVRDGAGNVRATHLRILGEDEAE